MAHVANVKQAAGCCTKVFHGGLTGARWLGHNIKSIGSSAMECAKNVASFVAQFFGKIGHALKAAFQATRGALARGWDAGRVFVRNHPREVRAAAIIIGAAAAVTVLTIVIVQLCRRNRQQERPVEA